MGRIGRTTNYGDLLNSLNDDQIYSYASLGDLGLEIYSGLDIDIPKLRRRVKGAMFQRARRHMFPEKGDGMAKVPGRPPVLGWYGWRWKKTIAFDEKFSQPEEPPVEYRGKLGSPMKYDHFITGLENFALFSSSQVIKHGEERGFFPADSIERKRSKRRVRESVTGFRRTHLNLPPDGYTLVGGRKLKAWYGWRWKLALPDYAFDSEKKQALQKQLGQQQPAPSVATGRRKRRWPRPALRGSLFLISVFLLAGLGFTVQEKTFKRGYSILREEGAAAAYRFFAKAEDPQAEFGMAWAAYNLSKYDEARAIALRLTNTRFAPDAFFLLGHLSIDQDQLDEAQEFLNQSQTLYDRGGNESNSALVELAQVRLALNRFVRFKAPEDLTVAESILGDYASRGVAPTFDYYSHLGDLYFWQANYDKCMEVWDGVLDRNAQNQDLRAIALTNIGACLIIQGNLEAGYEATQQAEAIYVSRNDQRSYLYNLLNKFLYRKCLGLNTDPIEKQILDSRPDRYLFEYLTLFKGFGC